MRYHVQTDGFTLTEHFLLTTKKTGFFIDREKGKSASEGLISLQLHPGTPMKVQFKNLHIKNIKP